MKGESRKSLRHSPNENMTQEDSIFFALKVLTSVVMCCMSTILAGTLQMNKKQIEHIFPSESAHLGSDVLHDDLQGGHRVQTSYTHDAAEETRASQMQPTLSG